MKKYRRFPAALSAASGLVLSIVLAGCGSGASADAELASGGWDEVVAAAEEEGKVMFYSGGDQTQAEAVKAAFEKEYPEIEVVIEKGVKDLFARIEAQMKSGIDGADVYFTADEPWFTDHKGEFLPMDGPNAAAVPADAWATPNEVATVHNSPYSVFVWNTKRFPKGFDDWADFVDPSVKGHLAFRGDAASKSAAGFLDYLKTTQGEDYLEKLSAQKPKKYPSVVPMTQAVAAGEAGVTMASLPSVVSELKASGAPIASYTPADGYGIGFQVAALKNAHRPNAAVVFTDFLLSPEGQEALNGEGRGGAILPNIPGTVDMSEYTMLEGDKFTPDVTAEWQSWIDSNF